MRGWHGTIQCQQIRDCPGGPPRRPRSYSVLARLARRSAVTASQAATKAFDLGTAMFVNIGGGFIGEETLDLLKQCFLTNGAPTIIVKLLVYTVQSNSSQSPSGRISWGVACMLVDSAPQQLRS